LSVPVEILELVERFERYHESYKSGQYNETQVRREFVDPFFKALGWDVDNVSGYAEAYKEVIHEDAIRVAESARAPDYCFRIGGARKFFVETKKPSVNLKDDIAPAFQVRRYAWSAKLPLSILTDFEELAVYDCRIKPDKRDKASQARTLYFNYREYGERWEEIAGIFSKESILKGSFDRYAETNKAKRGTAEVDTAFLEEIAGWRERLAQNIALRNPDLETRELNEAVQSTIDRIIFLRICEARGIERYGRLLALLEGERIYSRLCELFRQADERYNSGLFHFQSEPGREEPDGLTLGLAIDDRPLKEIIRSLYYPDSPYEFSVIPAEILGQVYEQFLGKVIRLTEGHRAKVEDKPEVKKAGGVFYTPSYIVQFIVKNTVGRLLEGKTPCQLAGLCILDPACGSGSFLIGAYQYLLDWHRDWYVQHLLPLILAGEKMSSPRLQWLLPPDDGDSGRGGSLVERIAGKRGKKGRRAGTDRSSSLGLRAPSLPIYMAGNGEWKLTTGEKKRILLSSIYGVDIDAQAVEVTKLSLHLKVLEEENDTTVSAQLTLFSERALPDLSNNIKCGNSLIGPDYYEGHEQEMKGLDLEERLSVNAFDWQREFPGVFRRGGFDAVIGNPPYVRQEGLGRFKEYFAGHYRVYHGVADLYAYFIERGVSLLRPAGLFSYIVANKWMRANYGQPLRAWLKGQHIEEIIDFGDLPVFARATTYPCILRISREAPAESFSACQVKSLDFFSLSDYVYENRYEIRQTDLDDSGWSLADEKTQALLDKLKGAGMPLGEYVQGKIYYGIKTGLNEAFVIDGATRELLIAEDPKSAELIKPFLAGRDIKRYEQPRSDKYLILMPRGWTREKSGSAKDALGWLKKSYPAIANHLLPFAQAAEKRCDKGEHWWELRACDYYPEFERQKLIYAEIAVKGQFTLDDNRSFSDTTTYIIGNDSKYLLGLLNSNLWSFLFSKTSSEIRGGFFRWKRQYMSPLPVRTIDPSRPEDVARHDRLVSLVEQMLQMHRLLASARTGHERTALERQIEATDGQIDRMVYELYGLTEEEIEIVEAASR
jgi:hypothetical protein